MFNVVPFHIFLSLDIDDRYNLIVIVITLYNVCSVDQGMFSTSGDTMSTATGYHEYIGDILSASEGVHIMIHVPADYKTAG